MDLCCQSNDQPRQHIKKQRHHFANKGSSSQSYGFSSSHVWMWELDHKEAWEPKNWCFWIVVLEKTLESPLDSQEIKPVNPKGNQAWISIGRTDAEAEAPILGHLVWRANSLEKKKRAEEDEIVGWHHQPNGREFKQILGDTEGQGSLASCSPWACKESDVAEWLNSDNERCLCPGAWKLWLS